jgi:hypothetical protein
MRGADGGVGAVDERGEQSLIDTYGATDPAKFFAVIMEAFFEQPKALRTQHPQLYAELKKFFLRDPAARLHSHS